MVPPGGEGKIILKVDTTGFTGRIWKTAIVRTNVKERPTFQLAIRARVAPYILVKPEARVLLRGIVGDHLRQIRTIAADDDFPLEISQIASNLDEVIAYRLRPGSGGHTYALEVEVDVDKPLSRSGAIRLRTNHPKKKDLTIPVYLQVRPEFEIIPARLRYGKVGQQAASSDGLRKRLVLVNRRGQPFGVKEVGCIQGRFQVKGHFADGGNKYYLEVRPRLETLSPGVATDTLIIRLDSPASKEFRVPLSIEVTP